ncbi:MAG: CDP-diacylglycerol--glycerol-3-phosphate 3-phosphatidyltransferase [Gammaproteobacteria bacterium]|nr:CDP-diacylglycerol--glycerol-3-phosphate 3-phosphatidyltransferase [Pseudomonadales bacterium]MCP5346109.1 CDP-diacylglycerol--glycerol-3-phosphate 3-phosphatidyltransferase [Pseudomonadales bacterium]
MFNLANIVTLIRVALVPLVVLLFFAEFTGHHLWAAAIFTAASISDWLDGYLARKLNQTSEFGAFLDPVADKLLVALTLILLVADYATAWFILPVSLIIGREILISALREWMAGRGHRDVVAVAFAGKVKTTVQMIAIIILLASDPAGPAILWQTGYVLIYVAAALSLYSMVIYFRGAWPYLIPGRAGKEPQ